MSRVLRMAPKPRSKTEEPICAVATRIVQLAVQEDCSAEDLAQLVVTDPALSMRVLALVNSAAFMLRNQVADVRQACSLLGVRGLRNLALSLAVSDMAPVSEEGSLLLANALRRALATQAIAKAMGVRQTDAYFTAGLFLDVGLMVAAREDLAYAADVARGAAAHRVLREQAAGKEPHPRAGAELARFYNLPPETVAAIEQHHDAQMPDEPLARACWLGERIAGVFESADLASSGADVLRAGSEMGLEAEVLEEILENLPDQVRETAVAYDRDLGEQPDLETLMADANASLAKMNAQYEQLVRQLRRLIEEKSNLERELREANVQLALQATTDALTGLMNKRAFEAALTRDLARASRQREALSLVMVDVDHFKRFNDTWGHKTGDDVLAAVGRLLQAQVRAGDVSARYGGEEFVLILPNTDEAGATVVAERVRTNLERMVVAGPQGPLHVTASFGIATVRGPGCETSAKQLFERADEALYVAKKAGRNQVQTAA